jgi:hypothetical protein
MVRVDPGALVAQKRVRERVLETERQWVQREEEWERELVMATTGELFDEEARVLAPMMVCVRQTLVREAGWGGKEREEKSAEEPIVELVPLAQCHRNVLGGRSPEWPKVLSSWDMMMAALFDW